MTAQDLINFENKIVDLFLNKKILHPVHLDNGNEEYLIKIFQQIYNNDWVCCSWRSHYCCLLKGINQSDLIESITNGESISLCFKSHKIISSAIVGSIIPIATGIAWSIKHDDKPDKVWCFIGDTTSETGIMHECWKYSLNFDLPITFVIADNGKSVCTDTSKVWNYKKNLHTKYLELPKSKIIYYKYDSKFPHAGVGQRINF